MILLVDMDDVIADLHTAWCEWYNRIYDDNMDPEFFRHDWAIHDHVKCGVDVYKILSMENFGRSLKPMEGAIDAMKLLYEKYNTCIVSSASSSGQFSLEKHLWLERHMPFFNLRRLILCHEKSLVRGDIILDDRHKNVNSWLSMNPRGTGILFEAPHNSKKVGGFTYRVHNWKEILECIYY